MGHVEYFWHHRPEEQHPPPSIVWPSQLDSGDRLAVACTQRDLAPSRQRTLVEEWCRLLPNLEGLKLLWLNSRVPPKLFEAACAVPGIEGLYVKWSGIKSLSPVENASCLRYLHVRSSPGIESIHPLTSLQELEWLGLENLTRIDDLSPVEDLRSLRGLLIEGSMWATQRVRTLEPIGRLSRLQYLSIANLRAADETLRPLFSLRNLQSFHAAKWWDDKEIEELRRLNPALEG